MLNRNTESLMTWALCETKNLPFNVEACKEEEEKNNIKKLLKVQACLFPITVSAKKYMLTTF